MAGAAPTPPPSESSKPAGPAIGQVSGDVVMGNKTVNMTAGGDIVLGNKITKVSNIYQAPSWGEAKYERNRQAMIQTVRDIWIKGVLDSSLYGAVLIPLGLEYQPEAVEQPWHLDPAARAVPVYARKLDLFDEANGALLILGQPGAGKTTSLLELARDLLERAEQNLTAPVPAIFSLASWAEKHPPLETWLAEELFRRYDVPRQLGRAWVQDDMLIPLLDGLDEVRAEEREACARAINAFRAEHGLAPLVVCSRLVDYEALGTRLRLRQAVVVQPLSPEQVDAHLAQFGDRQAALRQAVAQRADLRELAGTPLMLGVLMVVYQGQAAAIALKGSPAEQRTDLFSQYVAHMLTRSDELRVYSQGPPDAAQPDRSPYPDRLARHWLSWLARAMRRNGQTQFHLEWMQPAWLASPAQAALVTLGTSTLLALGASHVFWALIAVGARVFIAGWVIALVTGLTGGLAGGLSSQFVVGRARQNRGAQTDRAWHSAAAALAVLLGGGLVMGGLLIAFGEVTSELPVLVVVGWGVAFIGGLVGYS